MDPNLEARFVDYCLHEIHRKQSTVSAYLERIGWLESYLGKSAEAIDEDDLRSVKRDRSRGWSASTIKGMLVALKTYRRWAHLEGIIDIGKLDMVASPPVPNSMIRPLTVQQAAALLDACERPLDYRLVFLGCYAGLRIGESSMISDESWHDGTLLFRGEKNDRPREIPVHPELERVRDIILLSHPSPDTTRFQRTKKRLQRKTGIRFTPHQFRKTFSTTLHDVGVSVLCRKELLGHALGLDGIYTMVSNREKVEAITSLDYPTTRNLAMSQESLKRHTVRVVATEPESAPAEAAEDVRERALSALEPDLRFIVEAELHEVQAPRGVRAIARYSKNRLVLDVDGRCWHLQTERSPFEIEGACGHGLNPVSDETAAMLLAMGSDDRTLACCSCVEDDGKSYDIPSRIQPFVDLIRKAL